MERCVENAVLVFFRFKSTGKFEFLVIHITEKMSMGQQKSMIRI